MNDIGRGVTSEPVEEQQLIMLEQDIDGVLRADGKTPVHDFTDPMQSAQWCGKDFKLTEIDANGRQHAFMEGIGEGLSNNDYLVMQYGDEAEQQILLWEIVKLSYHAVTTLRFMVNIAFVGIVSLPKATH